MNALPIVGSELLSTHAANGALGFFLVLARLSPLIFFMPGIGEQTVPIRVRATVLLVLSAAAMPVVVVDAQQYDRDLGSISALIISETLIGAALAIVLRVGIWALMIVGAIIAQSIGLSQLFGAVVQNETQTTLGGLLAWAGVSILLSLNFHAIAIAEFMNTYRSIPIGSPLDLDPEIIPRIFSSAFEFAVVLSWPFVLIGILYNVSLGFINRALPQLMVAFVGAPFMVGAGLAFLASSIVVTLLVWRDRFSEFVFWM